MSIRFKSNRRYTARRSVIVVAVMGVIVIGSAFLFMHFLSVRRAVSLPSVAGVAQQKSKFPDIDVGKLSDTQRKIVQLTKQEWTTQPPGAKYSQGQTEPWCADFVSWIMKEAGVSLENPQSGGWRIPGTYTLAEYYQTNNLFRSARSGYSPQVGDVVVYRGSPIFGDHTNIVLKNDNGVLTTVGGNEDNRVHVTVNTKKDYRGLIGYGMLRA